MPRFDILMCILTVCMTVSGCIGLYVYDLETADKTLDRKHSYRISHMRSARYIQETTKSIQELQVLIDEYYAVH